MKKSIVFICLIFLFIFSINTTFAENLCDTYPDPENYTWSAEWLDTNLPYNPGQTLYTLTAPCKVFVGIPFDITVTVYDPVWPGYWVGSFWEILDTPDGGSTVTIAGGGWNMIIVDGSGFWTTVVSHTYTGAPVNHLLEFSFVDFGRGSEGHNWAGGVIGDIVVDPYPDECNDGDGDGICDEDDNCPDNANDDQFDTDEDGDGNACDDDDDNDSVLDIYDNCQYDKNMDQADYDNDGLGNVCDTDDDGDSVLDATDQCIFTTPGEVVNHTGCSIADLCDCENPWKNHGAYVSCVTRASEDFVSSGLISEEEKDAIVLEAGGSICGHKE